MGSNLQLISDFVIFKHRNNRIDKNIKIYKNLKLDATYDSLQKLVDLRQTLDNQCLATKKFAISTEPYTAISTVRLDKVELEFVRDSLYRVRLHTPYDYSTDRQLHEIFRAEFGEPSEERKTLAGTKYTTYRWVGVNAYIYIIQRDHADLDIEYGSFRGKNRSIDAEKKCGQQTRKST